MTKNEMQIVNEIRSLKTDELQVVERKELCEILGQDPRCDARTRIALAYLEGTGEVYVDHGGRGGVTRVELMPVFNVPF